MKISARISAHNLRSILKRSYAGVSAPGMERGFVGRLVARPGSRFRTTPTNQSRLALVTGKRIYVHTY